MKKPIGLDKLPEYLNSLRESDSVDQDLVVDMGRITESPKKSNWSKVVSLATAFCLFLSFGILGYNNFINKNIKIILKTDAISAESVSEIINDNGGNVVSVKKNADQSYEVEINKLKNIKLFLENLRKNKDIKKVELHEPNHSPNTAL